MTEILQSIPRSALPFDLSIRAFKPLTYGVMHLIVAISVAYALTQNWKASLAIGLIEPAVQTIAYTFHERAWTKKGA
ncbi:DUF2061 domain-containing protein [Oceanicaulis alexandrii]|uniref:DUF2061 domain-containing protein n=1 Tax=Oceanicaulis alexandrii TaxID=153233 RepID=UPI0035D012B6